MLEWTISGCSKCHLTTPETRPDPFDITPKNVVSISNWALVLKDPVGILLNNLVKEFPNRDNHGNQYESQNYLVLFLIQKKKDFRNSNGFGPIVMIYAAYDILPKASAI
jgi:hypothetical protein